MKNKTLFFIIFGAIVLCAVFAVVFIHFFNRKEEQNIQSGYSELPWEICSEMGIFYAEDGYLSFANPESGKRVLICNTAGCTHKSGECSASFDSSLVCGVSFMGDKLIYVSNEGVQDKTGYYIYTADLDGMNRKKLAFIPGIEFVSGVMMDNDRVIVCYQNTWDENNRKLEIPEAGIYIYDLKNQKGEVIYQRENQNAMISRFEKMGEGVVFSEYYNDLSKEEITEHASDEEYIKKHAHADLIYVSWSGREKRLLSENVELASYLKTKADRVYFVKNNTVYQCKQNGEEKKLPYSGGEEESISIKPAFSEDEILIQKYQKETEKYKIDYYDPVKEQSTSLGESGVSVIAQYKSYTYVFIPEEDSGILSGYIRTADMKKKKWDLAKPFGTEYLQQLEG